MKRVSLIIPSLLALLFLLGAPQLSAQQESNTTQKKKIVIVKKYTDEDGTVTVEKIVKEGAEADQLIQEIQVDGDGDSNTEIDIEVIEDGEDRAVNIFRFDSDDELSQDLNIEFTDDDGQKIIKMRRAGEGGAPEIIEWEGKGEIPADVQQKLDELGIDINHHKGGKGMTWIHGSAANCSDKAFLGVVISEKVNNENGVETREGVTDQGIIINEIVSNSAAEAAGLKEGDIISQIDGQAIRSFSDLTNVLDSKKPDDKISIEYVRDGQSNQTEATLKVKERSSHSFNWDHDYNFDFDFDFDREVIYEVERPCVFIGVYVNSSRRKGSNGAKITGIIDDTPASEAQLQRNDLIVAINDVEIGNYNELLTERNKYNPGDQVTLSILRDGAAQNIDITFRDCGEKETPKEEIFETAPVNPTVIPSGSAKLELKDFKAFPNPTAGQVTVRFLGEAVPTTINVVDVSGRTLFSETIGNFDGNYDQQIDLSQAPVGTLLLTIQQGEKIFTQTLVRSESTGL